MASILDLGGITFFQRVWPFLLVLTVVYSALGYVEMFKDNKGIRAMIAFIFAILASTYAIAWKTINLAAPWFVLLIFLFIFLMIAYQIFGIKQAHIVDVITGKTSGDYGRSFGYWTLGLILIITIGSLSSVVSEEKKFTSLREGGDGTAVETLPVSQQPLSEQVGFFNTITNPKVLGMILVMLIAFFTIANLAEK
jgi:hypothetical protein